MKMTSHTAARQATKAQSETKTKMKTSQSNSPAGTTGRVAAARAHSCEMSTLRDDDSNAHDALLRNGCASTSSSPDAHRSSRHVRRAGTLGALAQNDAHHTNRLGAISAGAVVVAFSVATVVVDAVDEVRGGG